MKKKPIVFLLLTLLTLSGCKLTPEPSSSDKVTSMSETSSETTSETSSEPIVNYTVTFWLDTVGTLYERVTVAAGEKVNLPTDPVRAEDTFRGWYNEKTFLTVFNSNAAVTANKDVYAKWASDEVTPEPEFVLHIVGELQNTDLNFGDWVTGPGSNVAPGSLLSSRATENLYYIELELGYGAEFKIKEPDKDWDLGYELNYLNVTEASKGDNVTQGALDNNILIKNAGFYVIDVNTELHTVDVLRTGDAVGLGVTPNPNGDEDVMVLHIIGDPANTDLSAINWGVDTYTEASYLVYNVTSETYTLELELGYGAEFKIKEPGVAWNAGYELDYRNVTEGSKGPNIAAGIPDNDIIIKNAGLYLLTVSTELHTIDVNRKGDAVGAGVTPNPGEDEKMQLHIIGDPKNSDLAEITWVLDTYTEASYLVYNETDVAYVLEIELGYGAEFKIKEPGVAWDAGYELDYRNVTEASKGPNISATFPDNNILIKNAGLYSIKANVENDIVSVIRIGDALGAGVNPNPSGHEVMQLHIVGNPENTNITYISWSVETYEDDSLLTYDDVEKTYAIELELGYGAEFKIKEPGISWNIGTELAFSDLNNTSDLLKLHEVGNHNVGIREAGTYLIKVDLAEDKPLFVNFIAPSTTDGVTQKPEEPPVVEKSYVIVGDFKIGDAPHWDPLTTNEYFMFNYDSDSNLHTLRLDLGHKAEFKVREVGKNWGEGDELTFLDLDSNFIYQYLEQEDKDNNIRVSLAGNYEFVIDGATSLLKVTWVKSGTETALEQTVVTGDLGIAGELLNGWEETGHAVLYEDRASGALFRKAMYFAEGEEWKIRKLSDITETWGGGANTHLPEGKMHYTEEGSNINVTVSGYYTVVFFENEIWVEETGISLRGNALSTGWTSEHELAITNRFLEENEPQRIEYSLTLELDVGEFRFKLATVGPYEGFNFSPSPISDTGYANYRIVEAGMYKVTVTLTFSSSLDPLVNDQVQYVFSCEQVS